jgi:hypothetical protein
MQITIAPPLLLLSSSGKNSSNKQKYFSSSARFYAGLEMRNGKKNAKQEGVNDGRGVKCKQLFSKSTDSVKQIQNFTSEFFFFNLVDTIRLL